MSEESIQEIVNEISERFDVESVEVKTPRSGQVIVDEITDLKLLSWLEERGYDVTFKFSQHYKDGEVEGTPVTFEIPYAKYVSDL